MTSADLVVRSTTDPVAFADVVAPLLAAEPVATSVVATNLATRTARPEPGDRWLWVEQDGTAVAAAMVTAVRGLHLPFADRPAAVAAIVDRLVEDDAVVPSISGWRSSVDAAVERWSRATGARPLAVTDQAAHVLGTLRRPSGVAGSTRAATPADADVVERWADGFAHDVDGEGVLPAPPEGRLAHRLGEDAGVRLREVDGVPVSMAYGSAAHGGVVRVSWVYTPPEHRRHGYAAACVADVATEEVGRGHRVMLYTDLANPTSNGVYARIGFERVADARHVRFGAAGVHA